MEESWLGWGAIDLAGGIVVHATAGVSALVLAKMIGPRRGFPKQLQPPHSPGLVMIGASLLWVGWFGFNAGSQGGASGAAGMTMLVTHISAATAALVWCLVERIQTGKTGVVGIATGMVGWISYDNAGFRQRWANGGPFDWAFGRSHLLLHVRSCPSQIEY